MKTTLTLLFLSSAPFTVLGAACNADNVLRALRANSAKASLFCSTYTSPPSGQPLPTYISQYPASRVSSACSCLATPTATTLTTTTTPGASSTSTTPITASTSSSITLSQTPSPTDYTCHGELIQNGNFEALVNYQPVPWSFAPETQNNGASTVATTFTANNNTYASLYINNGSPHQPGVAGATYFKQIIPNLCPDTEYTLTYSSQISIIGGQPGLACSVHIDLTDRALVFIGPPNGDIPPFQYQTRSTTFTYGGFNKRGNTLTVRFDCNAQGGTYIIDDISLEAREAGGLVRE